MSYFELEFDPDEKNWELALPWLLSDGDWRDVWAFTRCQSYENTDLLIFDVSSDGIPVDFNLANFNIPVVSKRLGDLLFDIAPKQIQRIPVAIGSDRNWEILNLLSEVDCLDHSRSTIDYFSTDLKDASVQKHPDMAGKPRGIRTLCIDAERTKGHEIFRITDWTVPIVVSESIKLAIEGSGFSGARFECVG